MKRPKFNFRSKKTAFIALAAAAVVGLGAFGAHKVLASNGQDCTNNSIIKCGEQTPSAFINQVKKNDDKNGHHDLQAIYANMGLPSSDYNKFADHAVMGVANQNGTITVNGQVVATNVWSLGRDKFSYAVPYKINGKTYYKSADTKVLLSNIPVMVLFNSRGVMQFAAMTACGNPATGTPKTPKYSCDQLNESHNGNTYTFSTKASASDGAKLVKAVYSFGDGSPTVTETSLSKQVTHTYTTSGTFTAKVTVYVSLPGNQTVTITSTKCEKQIPITIPFQKCVNLTSNVVDTSKREYQFVANTSQGNGSTLKSADFNFGDGQTATNVSPSSSSTVTTTHTYAAAKDYTITATVHFNTPNGVKNANCQTQINIQPPSPFQECVNLVPTLLDSTTNKYQFVANTKQGNGSTLQSADFNFADGQTQTGVKPSSASAVTTDHTFTMPQVKTTYNITATVHFNTPNGVKSSNCQTSITITPPAPFQKCVSLTPIVLDKQTGEVQFTVTTSQGNGSVLKGADFTFGDGQTATNVAPTGTSTVTTTHTYAQPGTYNITATVHFNFPGGEKDVNCTTSVNLTATPPPTCNELTITQLGGREIEAKVSYTANGSTLKNATFDFGDKTQPLVTTQTDVTYTYAATGNYTVTAALTFTLPNGQTQTVSSNGCVKTVNFTTPPTCTAPNGQTYPAGSPQCKPTCTAPNGQTFPAGSSQCKPTCTAPNGQAFPAGSSQCQPTVPTTLVNTGPGSIIGLFAVVTLASGFGYHFFLSRRLSRKW